MRLKKKKKKKRESEDNTPIDNTSAQMESWILENSCAHFLDYKVHDAFARDMKFLMTRASTLPFLIER